MTSYTMSAFREFGIAPAQTATYVRLFRIEPGQVPEVVGTGRFAVSYGEPVDVDIAASDGTLYVPAESWDSMRGEWACTAKAAHVTADRA